MTMVIATHEMGFAREVADRVCFIDGGRVLEEGPPAQMFTNPREERTRQFLDRVIRRGEDERDLSRPSAIPSSGPDFRAKWT